MDVRARIVVFALAVALPAASPAYGAASATDDQRLDTVLSQAKTALGLASGAAPHTLALREKITINGIAGTAAEWDDLQNGTSATYTDAGPQSGGSGYDGTNVWNEDAKGIVWDDTSGGEAIRARQDAYLTSYGLWGPRRGGAAVALAAPQDDRGHRYEVVRVTLPATPSFDLWFDANSHVPARIVRKIGRDSSQTQWSDYRAVAGLHIPYHYHVTTPGGNVDGTVTAAVANDPNAAAHLVRPVSHASDFSIVNGTSTTVPFELLENHVYLDVMVNGKGPFRLIFDTGGANILDVDVAKQLGLTNQGSVIAGGVGTHTEQAHFANVATLRIGDALLNDQVFFIAPVHHGFGVSGGKPVDGLIGFEVLARYLTTFDYQNSLVVLRMPDAPAPVASPNAATVLPIGFDGTTPTVACAINTISGTCTVDTGSRDSFDLHGPFIAAHPNVVPPAITQAGVGGFGLGGALINRLGRTTLSFGPFTLPGTVTGFTAQDAGAFADPFVAGNIGAGVLKRFTVSFDYAHKTMALVPNGTFAVADAYERSGMFLITHDDAIVVEGVRPGTPAADAGIVKGDTIAAVDGRPAASLGLDGIRRILQGPATTAIQLDVTSPSGVKKAVTLTLRDYV